ncbi:MAG TPA: aminotransferase class I/II-fold pyridoxal phosphate-dependent enzyme [Kofleriaceae bacterium]|jgi:cystathionine beta-lyase/cystathionine gamma-synthase|nr:aminotransferase class I/II-fold pyridoxal phosphate-dependent enzyme [Kofleriaceae bacterium]
MKAYLDPATVPAEPPARAEMAAATRELHDAIDRNAPYLHPAQRTIQRDLKSSDHVAAWQEAKAAFVLAGDGAWSELPQLYARYGTGGTAILIGALRELEHAGAAIVTDCGMQAVALVADALVQRGAHVVAMRQVYNKTRAFLDTSCKRVGATLALVDDGDLEAVARAIRPDTALVFAETFTNPLGRAQDVPALAAIISNSGARLVIDSTIATPWGVRAPLLELGAHVVVGSLTKALGGRDLALGGYVATNDAALANQLMDLVAMRGGILDDDRARRVAEHLGEARELHARRCATAARVAAALAAHPRIDRVFHPSRPDHPDAMVIARDYVRTGSLLAYRVRDADEAAHRALADRLVSTGVPRFALSFDGLATKVNHHRTVSEYFTPPDVVASLGIDRLIRLGIGLEDADDLIACLYWSLR